jgi:hypothetical protein
VLIEKIGALSYDGGNWKKPIKQGARNIFYILDYYYFFNLSISSLATASDKLKPISEDTVIIPKQETPDRSNLLMRLGNESNPVDGIFGPFTYGLRGEYTFTNKITAEAGYIRLHEPQTSLSKSVLDEAQLTVKFPEIELASQPIIVGITGWKNRMIDMYTNIFGLEATRSGKISTTLGFYIGNATHKDDSGRFAGAQLGISNSLSPVELGMSYMGGTIDTGNYQKIALDLATNLNEIGKIPLSITFAIEDRKFNFGDGGPVSESRDEFIFVTGLEFHFQKIHFL